LCEKLGVETGTLNFNGRNNLTAALQSDETFRNAVMEIIDERGGAEYEDEVDAVVETDFEELD
jgi:hypothetical protein